MSTRATAIGQFTVRPDGTIMFSPVCREVYLTAGTVKDIARGLALVAEEAVDEPAQALARVLRRLLCINPGAADGQDFPLDVARGILDAGYRPPRAGT